MTRFLVVEDEFVIAASLQSILEKNGYTVLQLVDTGEAAVEVAETSHPDLVLMDIALKGEMDGIEAAQQITSRFEIPVIYLTAHAHDEILERAKITQPFGYLTKPVKEKDLKVAIEIALYKHQMEHQLAEHDQWLGSILEAFEDAVIATDSQGRIELVNPIAAHWIGMKPEQVHGLPLREIVKLDHEGMAVRRHTADAEQGQGLLNLWKNFPFFTTPEGGKIPVECHQHIVYTKQGNPQGRLYVFRDISSIKTLEDELSNTKIKFEYFINRLVSAVLLCDIQGHFLDANQTTCDLLGYSRESLLAFSLSQVERGFDSQAFQGQLQQAKQDQGLPFQAIFQRKDHSSLPAEGMLGVREKKDRMIVLLVFQGPVPDPLSRNKLSEEFEQTYATLDHTFTQVDSLFQSFDLF